MPESQKPALSACVAYGAVFVNDGLVHVCVPEVMQDSWLSCLRSTLVFVLANLCIAWRFGERRLRAFPDPRDHGGPACFTLRWTHEGCICQSSQPTGCSGSRAANVLQKWTNIHNLCFILLLQRSHFWCWLVLVLKGITQWWKLRHWIWRHKHQTSIDQMPWCARFIFFILYVRWSIFYLVSEWIKAYISICSSYKVIDGDLGHTSQVIWNISSFLNLGRFG